VLDWISSENFAETQRERQRENAVAAVELNDRGLVSQSNWRKAAQL